MRPGPPILPAPPRPPRTARPAALRYGVALAALAAALALSLSLRAWMAPNVFLFFFAAVVVVAWSVGRGPSLLVALAAVPLVNAFFLPPFHLLPASLPELLRVTLFVALSLLVGTMREHLDEARGRAEEDAARLEEQAVELEAQAEQLAAHAEQAEHLNRELQAAQAQLRDSLERQLDEARTFGEERARAEARLAFLAEASRVLSSSLDYRATLATVTRLAVPALGDVAGLVLREGDGPVPVAVAAGEPAEEAAVWALLRRYVSGGGEGSPGLDALRAGAPVLVEETTPAAVAARFADAEAGRRVEALGVRAHLAVPLRVEERVIGVLTLAMTGSGRRYGPEDLALADELARRAATAVENARLHAAERDARAAAEAAADRVSRLLRVAGALSEARTPDTVAAAAVREAIAVAGARAAWIGRITPEGDAVEILHARGYEDAMVAAFRRMPLDARLPATDAARTGETVSIPSVADRDARYPELATAAPVPTDAAWAAVPLSVEGRVVGVLALSFGAAAVLDGETRDFLTAVARQAAVALERGRLFEAERAARAEAEAANRAKFEFLTTMSHELRTPLNAIAGYVELLDLGIRGPVTDAQREDLARIRRSQKHLLGLINDVLNFARIETGHVHFDVRDVPLDGALAELEELLSPQMQAKGLAYAYRPADADASVRADREKLQQIVLNLLSNAVKFTPPGGRIELECGREDGMVQVRVRDTGVGIPDDKLATIFEPFVQVNTGYTRTSEGTGLGLAISRDLARAMGGDLRVSSREGEGSVFLLTLPAGPAG